MLRRLVVAVLALLVVATISLAQEEKPEKKEKAAKKVVTGEVSAVTKDSLTILEKDQKWTFVVGKKTRVLEKGQTKKKGEHSKDESGNRPITEIVKTKQSVEVTYRDRNGKLYAGTVRVRG